MNELEKFECLDCEGQFIVNAAEIKNVKQCPFCQSDYIDNTVGSGDVSDLLESEMGCLFPRARNDENRS